MKLQNNLFLLIKSLTKNEKRYFRMHASLQGENKAYLKLFNEILKQKKYDETEIKKIFHGERFTNQLSVAKLYLYELIMKSLLMYHSEGLVDAKISNAILKAKILFKKALIPQYFKTLQKAKDLALKYERFGYLIEIYDMMRLIVQKERLLKKEDKKTYTEAGDAIAKLKNIFEYSSLLNKTFRIARTWGRSREKTAETGITAILESPSMANESNALSYRAKEIYYNILETAAAVKTDYNAQKKYLQKRYKLIEAHPHSFEGHIINYRKEVLQNLFHNLAENNNYEEISRYLKMYKTAFQSGDNIEEVSDFSFYSNIVLDTCIYTGNYSAGISSIKEIETGINRHKNKIDISNELILKFKIVKLLILASKYEPALEKLNILLLHPLLPIRADLECFSRLLNLLIHFELGNYELLEHLLRSTYRFLYKRDRLYKLETLILNFLRKTPNINSSESLLTQLRILRKEMLKLKNNPIEKKAFEYFDFIQWIDKKLSLK